MTDNIQKVRDFITEKASNPEFVHHGWFAKWHLEIVEKIAVELLQYYGNADPDLVKVTAWMHDYGKIVDFDTQYAQKYVDQGQEILVQLGFSNVFAKTVAENIKTLDKKQDIERANVETQIVSSADGCSHLVGPFFNLYWRENAQKPIDQIMQENVRKLTVDWDKKVVIKEARSAYQILHDTAMDRALGKTPSV